MNRGCESLCVSWAVPRGVGFVDLILCYAKRVFLTVVTPRFRGCHPFFVSLRCVEDCVGCPLYVGGLRETYVCDVLSSGFGASVLVFFGERGPVDVGHGCGPEWSGTGRLGDERLGAWRSVRADLGRLLGADPSV